MLQGNQEAVQQLQAAQQQAEQLQQQLQELQQQAAERVQAVEEVCHLAHTCKDSAPCSFHPMQSSLCSTMKEGLGHVSKPVNTAGEGCYCTGAGGAHHSDGSPDPRQGSR